LLKETTVEKPYLANDDTYVIPTFYPVPTLGLLPINAFLIKAKEPVLIDTHSRVDREEFLKVLWSLIDPKDLKYVFMTHEDGEHGGNVEQVLEAAPNARLVTNFLGVGKLMPEFEVPLHRVYLVNHGQSFNVGDRDLTAVRPPLFDSAATAGVYDTKTSTLFSVDSFGAFIPTKTEDAADIPQGDFTRGFNLFNQGNHPWSALVDQGKFEARLKEIDNLGVRTILSTHLPAAYNCCDAFLKALSAIPSQEPFVGPDQAALEAMLAQMAGGGPPS
jgi:flavorubredoxin